MASSARADRPHVPFPSRGLLCKPSTWRNRGRLVGSGSPQPLDFAGAPPGLLAIHGFGGTPREVAILVEVARRRGLRAVAPLLPGHGTRARELATATFAQWLQAARLELTHLQQDGPVILAGLSMGAVIAARLAAAHNSALCGLALYANAFRLASPYPAKWLSVAAHLPLPTSWWLPKLAPDIECPKGRQSHLGYDAEPVRAAIELYRAGIETLQTLHAITCPTLLVHGARDRVCPVNNVELVTQRLGTRDVTRVILPDSGHVVTEDYERQRAADVFDEFITRFL